MQQIEEIRQAARQLVRELHLLDGRHDIAGFSFSECHLLTELQQLGQATASELAEILVLEKSTVSRLVNGLIGTGLLESGEDDTDRRRRLLRLTPAGEASAENIHTCARQQVNGALDYVADTQIEEMVGGLGRYARALQYVRRGREFSIRPIEPGDNEPVAEIIRAVMTGFGAVGEGYSIEDPEVDDMFTAYAGDRARFWVIEHEGIVKGCGGFAPLTGGQAETCELQKMYFMPGCRGLGLGSRLLKICLEEASALEFRECYLETLTSMEAARRLYEKHGFRPINKPMGNTGHSACNSWMIRKLP